MRTDVINEHVEQMTEDPVYFSLDSQNAKEAEPEVVRSLKHTKTIDGKLWLAGAGDTKSKIMIILPFPFKDDITLATTLSDAGWNRLKEMATLAKLDLDNCYITYGLKYLPSKKKPTQKEYNSCKEVLFDEIQRVKPQLAVVMGAEVTKMIFGSKANITQFEGGFITNENYPKTVFMPLYSPSYVTRYPEAEGKYIEALARAATMNIPAADNNKIEYTVVSTVEDLRNMVDTILSFGPNILALDCEWEGIKYVDEGSFIRTVQLKCMCGGQGPDDNNGPLYVVELYDCRQTDDEDDDSRTCLPIMDQVMAYSELKRLLESPTIGLIGHNIREDGHWLSGRGIHIRNNTIYDTMIAEHCMNSLGPFGLEVLTCKYTTLGRYDIPLSLWKNNNKKWVTKGYGFVPRGILIPYSAYDVEATMRIFKAQMGPLKEYLQGRGEYPSLFDTAMYIANLLYELEDTGMLIDREHLKKMTRQYHDKRASLEKQLQDEALSRFKMEDFNHDSSPQRQTALFTHLGLAPVLSTEGKEWAWVVQQSPEVQKLHSPATNKLTLEILKHSDPFVNLLLSTRRIATVCKNFLRDDEDGGIPGNIWPDGRIHARFSQLAETGRFRHSKPNVANFPKSAEGYIGKIFSDEEEAPEDIRSIIISDPGMTFVEADFVQAELFVLAALSNDKVMMDALTTPGKDLHDMTAVSAFRMKVLYPDGSEVREGELEKLALEYPKQFKDELLPQLIYVKSDGTRLTRDQFKKGIRVSAKAINFGIPYGRGAKAIANQILAETGLRINLDEMKSAVMGWKDTYYGAAAFMKECGEYALSQGYIENPWGRRRFFARSTDQNEQEAVKREAANWPIQSTVSDTILISMYLIAENRAKYSVDCKIINPIHDALMLSTPDDQVGKTKTLLKETMGNITIPVKYKPLILGIDISEFKRW